MEDSIKWYVVDEGLKRLCIFDTKNAKMQSFLPFKKKTMVDDAAKNELRFMEVSTEINHFTFYTDGHNLYREEWELNWEGY